MSLHVARHVPSCEANRTDLVLGHRSCPPRDAHVDRGELSGPCPGIGVVVPVVFCQDDHDTSGPYRALHLTDVVGSTLFGTILSDSQVEKSAI